MENDIYVVVADSDHPFGSSYKKDEDGAIVFEQYTKVGGLEEIKKRAKRMSARYGRCRVAKLEFTDIEFNESKKFMREDKENGGSSWGYKDDEFMPRLINLEDGAPAYRSIFEAF
jgi:hypothetical protein